MKARFIIEKRNKKRIAVYARGKTDEAVNRQIEFYKEKYNYDETVEIIGFYADIGNTGKIAERVGMQQLITDCKEDGIKEIHTKSISRISRDMAEFRGFLREMEALGVAVVFDGESISTGTEDGKKLMSFLEKHYYKEGE